MFAGIYRDFAGKLECGDFKFMGIACIPAIPVIFEVNQKKVWTFYIYSLLRFFKFPANITMKIRLWRFQNYRDCRYTCNPHKFEIPELRFPCRVPVIPCKHLQCMLQLVKVLVKGQKFIPKAESAPKYIHIK